MSRSASLRSRSLALGLLLVVVALVATAVLLPLTSAKQQQRERIDEMLYRLDRYRGIAISQPVLETQYEQIQQSHQVNDAYLNQKTSALAIATLQRIAKRHISGTGGRLSSIQVNPIREDDRFARISINVRMRTSLENLVKLFHALENGRPSLFIGQVVLRGVTSGSARRRNKKRELDVRFDLAGYMKVEGA